MTDTLRGKADYLHDALVRSIALTIDDEGNRLRSIHVHCHPDCGLTEWNEKKLRIEFVEPLVVRGELHGHMANAEEINSVEFMETECMSGSMKYLTDAGIAPPSFALSVLFQSGSQLDICCQEIHVINLENAVTK